MVMWQPLRGSTAVVAPHPDPPRFCRAVAPMGCIITERCHGDSLAPAPSFSVVMHLHNLMSEMRLDPTPSRPYLGAMLDPRTPEILAWVDAMPIAERLTVMHAMSFAFPILKNDQDWTARVSAVWWSRSNRPSASTKTY